jgi:hypothetical protein
VLCHHLVITLLMPLRQSVIRNTQTIILGFSSDEEKCIRILRKQPPGKSFSETDFWYQTCQHQNGQQAAEAGCALLSCLLDYFSKIKSYGPSLASFPGQSH